MLALHRGPQVGLTIESKEPDNRKRTNLDRTRRVIVGFDLRRLPVRGLANCVSAGEISDIESSHAFTASIDPDVWPSLIEETNGGHSQFGHTNCLNLLGLPDFWSAKPEVTRIAVPAAFDLSIGFLETIGRAAHVTQLEIFTLEALNGWRFLGFDITDRYVGYSALWSRHFFSKHINTQQFLGGVPLNPNGLVADFELALSASIQAQKINGLEDHAPFAPCGVWVKCTIGAAS